VTETRLRTAAILLTLAGIAVAGYLTWVHYEDVNPVCVGGGGSCEKVQTSEYADLIGIPVAVIGVAGYLTVLSALLIRIEVATLFAAAVALISFGFAIYLTYLELFVIEAICQWCVANAAIETALAATCVALVLKLE
jgi:uncharacterized membrane protein